MTTTDHAYRVLVDERIAELLRFRQWYRRTPWAAEWSDLRKANEVELRSLLALARKARRMAAAARDPIDAYKAAADRGQSYHDWQAR